MKQDENQTKIIKDINSDINLLPSLVEKKFKIKKDIENINQEILIYESNIKLLENKENNIMNLNILIYFKKIIIRLKVKISHLK